MKKSDRVRILVVDDERHARVVASTRLRGAGYDVVEAPDGLTAIERIREGGIAVVVLDAMMPEMDGFEVLKRLQKLENHPSVLFLTALDKSDSRLRALYGGAVDYIGKPFDPAEFLARIAVAVREHARTQGALEEARTDGLTGMKNRRSYDLSIAAEFARAVRYQRPLALVLLDIDGLKKINDTDGHAAGDAAISKVASLLMKIPRETDRPARMGGDEFAVVLPESGLEETTRFIERFQEALSAQGSIGVSIGFALFPADASDEAGLQRVADERLYREKAEKKPAGLYPISNEHRGNVRF